MKTLQVIFQICVSLFLKKLECFYEAIYEGVIILYISVEYWESI